MLLPVDKSSVAAAPVWTNPAVCLASNRNKDIFIESTKSYACVIKCFVCSRASYACVIKCFACSRACVITRSGCLFACLCDYVPVCSRVCALGVLASLAALCTLPAYMLTHVSCFLCTKILRTCVLT